MTTLSVRRRRLTAAVAVAVTTALFPLAASQAQETGKDKDKKDEAVATEEPSTSAPPTSVAVRDPACRLPDGSLTFGSPDPGTGLCTHVPDVRCSPELGCADLGLIGKLQPPPPGAELPAVQRSNSMEARPAQPVRRRASFTG